MCNATDVHLLDCDELPSIFDVDDGIHFFPEKIDEKSNKNHVKEDFRITVNNEKIGIREEEIEVKQIDESNEFCLEVSSYIPSWFDAACQNIEPFRPLQVSQLTHVLKEEINSSQEYFPNYKSSDLLTMKSVQKISF